jgi:hypothetical protein
VGDLLTGASTAASIGAALLYLDAADPFADFVGGALSAHAENLTELYVVGDETTIPESRVDALLEAAEPIEIMEMDRLRELLDDEVPVVGTAHTVIGQQDGIPGSSAIDPVTFTVRVRGIDEGGAVPGVPMILVRASGDVIDLTEGIVSGMSGSPVYVEDEGETKLLGAIAFGCWFCDQRFGGVTPAESMLEVLDYPGSSPSLLAGMPESTTVSAGGTTLEMRNLMSLGISGLAQRRLQTVKSDLERAGHAFNVNGSFKATTFGGTVFRPFDPLFPGHSIAGVVSAGHLSFAGIGTTTFRRGDRSLGFGHPFFVQGPSGLGLASARIDDVVADKAQIFGGFKVGSVTGAHGIMDQDRWAAIGGTQGTFPGFAEIVSNVENIDTAKSRVFQTDSVMISFFPDIAAISLLVALDATFDRIGGGAILQTWTIEGRRGDGSPFSVSRTNRYSNRWDVTFEAIWDLLIDVYRIQENRFEHVTFDRITTDSQVTQVEANRRIIGARVRTSSSSRWVTDKGRLVVRPGDRITIRAQLSAPRSDVVVRELSLRVPPTAAGRGVLTVSPGGGGGWYFFFDHEESGGKESSLDDVLAGIEGAARNDELSARLTLTRPGRKNATTTTKLTPWVLSGRVELPVRVAR